MTTVTLPEMPDFCPFYREGLRSVEAYNRNIVFLKQNDKLITGRTYKLDYKRNFTIQSEFCVTENSLQKRDYSA